MTRPFPEEDELLSIAVSENAILAAGSYNGHIRLYDISRERHLDSLRTTMSNGVTSIGFSPAGNAMVIGAGTGEVELWNLDDRQQWISRPEDRHTRGVARVSFSPNGHTIASASADQTVKVWDAKTGALRQTFDKHTGWVTALAFCPTDSECIATGGWDGRVMLWEPTTGMVRKSFVGNATEIHDLLFLPDGKTLVTANGDRRVQFFDVATGMERIRLLEHDDAVRSLAASRDGRLLVSGGRFDHTIHFWRFASDAEVDARWSGTNGDVYQ
jgi:WD40 repeat protein